MTGRRTARRAACLLAALALAVGCRSPEPLDAARDRATAASLSDQIADLRRLVARAETGDFVSEDRIAVSISETVVKRLLDASLPQEVTIAGSIRVRILSAQPLFRGGNASVVFQAVARGLEAETPAARLELAGTLERVRIERDTLIADVDLAHFEVLDTSLGDIAADVLESLVTENKDAFKGLLDAVEIPVHLKQAVDIEGLDEGVVVARAGALPVEIAVAEVIPVRERLWVLLDAKAGPWTDSADKTAAAR